MKRFNINELVWFIILASFAYYIYELFNTGKIEIYMHPRMFRYIFFSFVIFILLAIFQIRKIFTYSKSRKIKLGYIIFIVPLFLALAVNPNSLGTQIVSNKGFSIINYEKNSLQPSINANSYSKDNYYDAEGEEFKKILINTYENLDEMLGKEVELSGFVYREPDSNENRFVISRLALSCCAADAQIAGLLCEWDESSKLKDNEWIKVTGMINSTTYHNENTNKEEIMPLIEVTKTESIEAPKNQYIYP